MHRAAIIEDILVGFDIVKVRYCTIFMNFTPMFPPFP